MVLLSGEPTEKAAAATQLAAARDKLEKACTRLRYDVLVARPRSFSAGTLVPSRAPAAVRARETLAQQAQSITPGTAFVAAHGLGPEAPGGRSGATRVTSALARLSRATVRRRACYGRERVSM